MARLDWERRQMVAEKAEQRRAQRHAELERQRYTNRLREAFNNFYAPTLRSNYAQGRGFDMKIRPGVTSEGPVGGYTGVYQMPANQLAQQLDQLWRSQQDVNMVMQGGPMDEYARMPASIATRG